MRAATAPGIAILSAASWHSAAEARGGRSGGGGSLVPVRGYVNSRGTYVARYYRTKADGILTNNLSCRGGASSYTLRGSVPVASADPLDVPATTVATAPSVKTPWCSDGMIISGFCVLNW